MRLRIRARLRKLRINRVLKDSGCSSWYEYHMVNDPAINIYGTTVTSFYAGYAVVMKIPFHLVVLQPSYDQGLFSDGTVEFRKWCKHNCEGKYRVHWHRTRSDGEFDYFDVLNGGDAVLIAFENETDAARFALTWL